MELMNLDQALHGFKVILEFSFAQLLRMYAEILLEL